LLRDRLLTPELARLNPEQVFAKDIDTGIDAPWRTLSVEERLIDSAARCSGAARAHGRQARTPDRLLLTWMMPTLSA